MEHFLDTADIVVFELVSASRKTPDLLRRILHVAFRTQVVYFDHHTMLAMEKVNQMRPSVSVEGCDTVGGEASCNDVLGYISEIKRKIPKLMIMLPLPHFASQPVAITTLSHATLLPLNLLLLPYLSLLLQRHILFL